MTALKAVVRELQVSRGFTSLARGADQLYANILREKSIPFTAVIPCANYRKTFAVADRQHFEHLLSLAAETIVLAFPEPSETAFYEAGKRIVEESENIVAAWDGKPARGLGGTADIVEYALLKGRKVIQIDPATGGIVEL